MKAAQAAALAQVVDTPLLHLPMQALNETLWQYLPSTLDIASQAVVHNAASSGLRLLSRGVGSSAWPFVGSVAAASRLQS